MEQGQEIAKNDDPFFFECPGCDAAYAVQVYRESVACSHCGTVTRLIWSERVGPIGPYTALENTVHQAEPKKNDLPQ